jgi:hypothetical protein
MKRVLIVNKCGLLSALPTEKEFCFLDFETENKIFGLVEVTDEDAAKIHQESTRVRVLMPDLPKPERRGAWLYVAVVKGRLVLVNAPRASINIQKGGLFSKLVTRIFAKISKFFQRL